MHLNGSIFSLFSCSLQHFGLLFSVTKMSKSKEVADEYLSSLADLTVNSKPLINMLTMLADENVDHAPAIVQVIESHIEKVIEFCILLQTIKFFKHILYNIKIFCHLIGFYFKCDIYFYFLGFIRNKASNFVPH